MKYKGSRHAGIETEGRYSLELGKSIRRSVVLELEGGMKTLQIETRNGLVEAAK